MTSLDLYDELNDVFNVITDINNYDVLLTNGSHRCNIFDEGEESKAHLHIGMQHFEKIDVCKNRKCKIIYTQKLYYERVRDIPKSIQLKIKYYTKKGTIILSRDNGNAVISRLKELKSFTIDKFLRSNHNLRCIGLTVDSIHYYFVQKNNMNLYHLDITKRSFDSLGEFDWVRNIL